MLLRALVLTTVLALSGCSGSGAGPVDAARPIEEQPPLPPPRVAPERFDCRATTPPERTSPAPLDCATDPACTERLLSAHRGAGVPGTLAPENTLAAIRASIAAGADLVEIDVRPSADGVLVLMHDDAVDRTTTGTGRVDTMTLAELQALELHAESYAGDFSCERVPTFADALELAAGRVTLVVDATKTDDTAAIVRAIEEADAIDRVVFDHPDPAVIEAALALEPGLRFLVRATTVEDLDALLARFAATPPVYVHVEDAPLATMAPAVRAHDQRVFALGFGADVVAGIRGDTTAYGLLFEQGAQMLQSNRPELLARALWRL
jgi:glycerophosphoryl diester phosphodiesterase